jgi:prepilin-type N-terminal cleavage/methylation domain-containing protein
MSGIRSNPFPTSRGPRTAPHLRQRVCHRFGHAARTRREDDGFTLIEVVVSFVLFAIVAGAAATGIVNSIRASHRSEQRVDAANVAQSILAAVRAKTSAAQNGTTTLSAPVGNQNFSVQRTIAFDTTGATQCSSGATFAVTIVVSSSTGQSLARTDARVLC